MPEGEGSSWSKDDLVLREFLAAERTALADERTFLAYVRTALTLFVAGASFVQFFGSQALVIVGWLFLPLALMTFVLGLLRWLKIRSRISSVDTEAFPWGHEGGPTSRLNRQSLSGPLSTFGEVCIEAPRY